MTCFDPKTAPKDEILPQNTTFQETILYCKEDPWQVSQKVRTIYYALLHRELSGYNPRREGEMNQVNEQSWKNPDENNNSIFYNFDHNKIETDDSFSPSQVKYSENTVIKEQFFRPASTIRKPKHKKQHFKISKDDYHSQIKETDERSLTLFSLDTLQGGFKMSYIWIEKRLSGRFWVKICHFRSFWV